MLNEGIIVTDAKAQVKSEMLRQLWAEPRITPERWEERVFGALLGAQRGEVDFKVEDNQAGYYTWVRSFDQLIAELIEDGYVREEATESGSKVLVATEAERGTSPAQLVYSTRG
jgi:hypothetical protein